MATVTVDLRITGTMTVTPHAHHSTPPQPSQRATAHNLHAVGDTEAMGGRKRAAARMAAALHRLGYLGRAGRMALCGEWMRMAVCPNGDHQRIVDGSYCRDRMCPICEAGRARRMAREITEEMEELKRRTPGVRYVLVTLTAPNVAHADLRGEVQRQLKAWGEMARRSMLRRACVGWVRRCEITYNEDRTSPSYGTHHVHIHAILAVRPGYYHDSGLYMTQEDIRREWAYQMGVQDGAPCVVDIRSADAGGRLDVARELAKYAVKPMTYVPVDEADVPGAAADAAARLEALRAVIDAIHGARMVSWGGDWRRVRHDLGRAAAESEGDDADMEDTCPVCGTPMEVIAYAWAGSEYAYCPAPLPGNVYTYPPWGDRPIPSRPPSA